MFNDEQLAYAEIVQKVTEDALGFWKDRALKAEAERDALLSRPAPPADAAPLTSDVHTSCDWCKRDIPNACYAVLCSDCDRRGNTALFAPPADAAETPGTNKVEASDGDRDHKGADLKQDGGGNAADGEGPALLGVQQADGALPDGAAGRVLLAVSVLRGGAADRSVAPPADAATEAVREAAERLLEDYAGVEDMLLPETAEKVMRLRAALSTPAPAPSAKEGRT